MQQNTTAILKCIFTRIKDGGRRHLKFRKSVAISSLLDQSSSNLMGMLVICYRTQLFNQKCIFTKIKDGGRRHLEIRKSFGLLQFPDPISGFCNRSNFPAISHNATSDLKVEIMINGTGRIQRNAQQVFLTKHVVNIKYRPAGRKTANINVKNYIVV